MRNFHYNLPGTISTPLSSVISEAEKCLQNHAPWDTGFELFFIIYIIVVKIQHFLLMFSGNKLICLGTWSVNLWWFNVKNKVHLDNQLTLKNLYITFQQLMDGKAIGQHQNHTEGKTMWFCVLGKGRGVMFSLLLLLSLWLTLKLKDEMEWSYYFIVYFFYDRIRKKKKTLVPSQPPN